ncbi:MAG: hypothetical protein HRU75_02870 [Planctomycetia bacterium]|nr:MAG: hypothetical protein HRU75_02870 [Planctomycetia bacterium]
MFTANGHLRTLGVCRQVTGAVTILAACAVALAQHSVQQDGRMFDANPQVGGSRVNTPRSGVTPNLPGNYQAVGNARYGQSLRSYSPIPSATAFRAPLGSAALAPFRRDSVAAYDAYAPRGAGYDGGYYDARLAPVTAGRQPYHDPAVTVPDAARLRAQPLGTPIQAIAPQGTIGGPPTDTRLDWRIDTQSNPSLNVGRPVYRWQGGTSLFGMRPAGVPSPLNAADERIAGSTVVDPRAAMADAVRPATAFRTPESMRPPGSAPLGTPLDVSAAGASAARPVNPSQTPPSPADFERPPTVRSAGRPTMHAEPLPRAPVAADPSLLPGYDTFTDMRLALALDADPGARWFDDMRTSLRDNPAVAAQQLEIAQLESADFVSRMVRAPMRSFVGGGPSMLNNELLKAESLMHIGQFYDAAGRFEAARSLEPNNPLPLLGKGHALLAAGEYLSAAVAIIAGLERYPELAKFNIDLQALLGDGEIVDIRRADILDRLREQEEPRLRFLLGYLEYHAGMHDSGMAHLEKAASTAAPSSILADYPRMLRGEARPPLPRGLQSPGRRPASAMDRPAAPRVAPADSIRTLPATEPAPPALDRAAPPPGRMSESPAPSDARGTPAGGAAANFDPRPVNNGALPLPREAVGSSVAMPLPGERPRSVHDVPPAPLEQRLPVAPEPRPIGAPPSPGGGGGAHPLGATTHDLYDPELSERPAATVRPDYLPLTQRLHAETQPRAAVVIPAPTLDIDRPRSVATLLPGTPMRVAPQAAAQEAADLRRLSAPWIPDSEADPDAGLMRPVPPGTTPTTAVALPPPSAAEPGAPPRRAATTQPARSKPQTPSGDPDLDIPPPGAAKSNP